MRRPDETLRRRRKGSGHAQSGSRPGSARCAGRARATATPSCGLRGGRADSMADRYNEGKALDAVLRFIEARDHAPRENDGQSPDDQKDPDEQRRVDYVCTVGRTLYAFAHTSIQPFPTKIKLADHN